MNAWHRLFRVLARPYRCRNCGGVIRQRIRDGRRFEWEHVDTKFVGCKPVLNTLARPWEDQTAQPREGIRA